MCFGVGIPVLPFTGNINPVTILVLIEEYIDRFNLKAIFANQF
jgi:hypothetical protein